MKRLRIASSELRSVSTARVDGCQKMHPSSRAVNSARELGPWTRVMETDLYEKSSCQDGQMRWRIENDQGLQKYAVMAITNWHMTPFMRRM